MSDISVPVIDRVLELAPAALLQVDGFTYIDKDKTTTLHKPPVPTAIKLSTLDGLVDLLEASFEKFPVDATLVHVVSHDSVEFLNRTSDMYGRRQTYIVSTRVKPEKEFKFNVYLPQEEFVIALYSLFAESDARTELIQLAGNIAKETEVRQLDDGISQQMTVKGGMRLVSERTVKPRVTLKPFRTFLEAEQPDSDFIFRVTHNEMQGNMCALFEADGGRWKLNAIENVKTWLTNRLKGSTVAGLPDIPVIA